MFENVHIFHDTTLTNKQTGEPIIDKFGEMKACGRFFNRARKYDEIEDREPYKQLCHKLPDSYYKKSIYNADGIKKKDSKDP